MNHNGVDDLTSEVENSTKLPEGWSWTTVGDISEKIHYGYTARSTSEQIGPKMLRITDIQEDAVNWDYVPYCKIDSRKKQKYLLREGDLVFARTGATVGKSFLIRDEIPEAVFASYLIRIILSRHIVKELIYYFFRSKAYWEQIRKGQIGIGQPNVNSQTLSKFVLPLPPIAEQHRIVAKIESLFAESRSAQDALGKVLVLLRRFRQSVLTKAFRAELTEQEMGEETAKELLDRIREERRKRWEEDLRIRGKDPRKHKYKDPEPQDTKDLSELPANWTWTNIGTITTFIGSGITPRGGKKVYVEDGIPFIRSQNVYPDGLHVENVAHVTPELHAKMKRTHVKPGDVLLNITGASIGRSTYVPDDFGPANVSQHVCIIRTGHLIIPPYLSSFLNSQFGQSQIFSAQSGVTREGLNYSQLRALRVPLAPFEEQRRIVARIRVLFIFADQTEESAKASRTAAEMIEQAILTKAFRGELVTQDPNDEPASVLLHRIEVDTAKKRIKARKRKREIRSPRAAQLTLAQPRRDVLAILKERGQAPVEQVFQASGLSTSDFWDEVKTEIDAGRIEQIRKGNLVILKVKI